MANPWEKYQKTPAKPWEKFQEKPKPVKESGFDSAASKFMQDDAAIFEPALTIASSALATPASGLRGIYELATGADSAEAAKVISETQRDLTYQPRTEEGRKSLQRIGEGTEAVGDFFGHVGDFFSPVTDPIKESFGPAVEQTGKTIGSIIGAHPLIDLSPEQADALGQTIVSTAPAAAAELAGGFGTIKRTARAIPEPEYFGETGVRATAGEKSQDFAKIKEEKFLEEQSSGAGQQMREFRAEQSREIDKYLRDAADIEGAEPAQLGESIKRAVELRKNSSKLKRKQAYNRLAEYTKDMNVGLNTDIVKGALPDERRLKVFERTNSGQFNALEGVLQDYGVISGGDKVDKLSVNNYEDFRQLLGDIEKSDQTGRAGSIIGPIRESLDSEFEMAAKALEASGAPDVARAAKNARKSHVALKTEFDEKGIIDKLVANQKGSRIPKIEESQVFDRLSSKALPVEQFETLMDSLNRAGSKGKRAKENIKAQMMLDVIDSGFSAKGRKVGDQRIFGANSFQKRFDELEPKLKKILTPAEYSKIRKFRDQSDKLIPPSGAIPKGSAGFLVDLIKRTGLASIPAVGPIMADSLSGLINAAGDSSKLRRALQNPKTREAAELIEGQYPALAATLGIGALLQEDTKNQNQ